MDARPTTRRRTMIALGALLLHRPVLAHTNAELANQRGPQGGQMRATTTLHLELVGRADELLLYVYDHDDRPVATAGAAGRATLLLGAQRSELVLEPYGKNVLRAAGKVVPDPKLRVVVSLTLSGGKPQQERFEPFRPLPVKK
jgi:hypothetical protein